MTISRTVTSGAARPDTSNTFSEDQIVNKQLKAARLAVYNDTDVAGQNGVVVSNQPGVTFDKSRRMVFVFSRQEQTVSGSTFLTKFVKEGPSAQFVWTIEGECGTSADPVYSTGNAACLGGVQGLVRHRSATTLPRGVGLAASVQLETAGGGSISQASGVHVWRPETYGGSATTIDKYYGVYVSGDTDATGDASASNLVPNQWYGVYIRRGTNTGLSTSRSRSIWAEGRATFRAPGAGGLTIDMTYDVEAFPRWALADDGSLQFGTGAVATDTFLGRGAARVLSANGTAVRVGNFTTATLPSPSSLPGMLAWDTTTSQLKASDGTAWRVVTLT